MRSADEKGQICGVAITESQNLTINASIPAMAGWQNGGRCIAERRILVTRVTLILLDSSVNRKLRSLIFGDIYRSKETYAEWNCRR